MVDSPKSTKEKSISSLCDSPTVEQLEEILHGGQLSCNHVDEVWPNLFLGDMYMSHDRCGLWRLGITHVLNAAHGKMCCKGSDDFYGTTVQYYGVAANDLPTFDISPFFYPSAQYIHQALSTPRALQFPSLELRGPNLFQHDNVTAHKVRPMKTRFAKVGMEELKHRAAQSPVLNPTEYLWDELER
ncbi:hypothetical protein PDJAM_G00184960 [Pangasius djambal]|uniref:Uncharacterized protein n=1 Tax=Pangasius djambal TaxID=1691987 RepID=A0ACC5Y4X8_9TELE|nr:hypothetical protein [Pangasius djambal]